MAAAELRRVFPPPKEGEAQKSDFLAKLEARWQQDNFVCVGLDSDYSKIPEFIRDGRSIGTAITMFNIAIIDATHDLVCAYKPNIAFYEEHGADGWLALVGTVRHIQSHYPDIPVILDAKRADIGSTNRGYVRAIFDFLEVDAVTVHPYLGREALAPFLSRLEKGIIVLARTSNPGAGELQDLPVPVKAVYSKEEIEEYVKEYGQKEVGKLLHELYELPRGRKNVNHLPLYQIVAWRVARHWNRNGNCGVVVGATYPQELVEVRKIVGDMPILLPGIGAQGGEVEATVKAGKDSRGWGMIVNSSRGIIFASNGPDFAEAARRETERLRDQINSYR